MSGRRARVMYLAHAFMVGGAEEMTLNLVRHLPPRFEPRVMCIHEAGPMGEEMRAQGMPVEVLGLTPGLRRPLDLLRLRDAIFAADPDIVHAFLLTGSLYGRFASMLAGVPVIVGTEVNIYEQKRPSHARAERWLLRSTDAVVASAEAVRDYYVSQIGADRAKIEVIYNAVDWGQLAATTPRDAFLAAAEVPAGAPVAGIIARLTEQKAHTVLFDAMARTPALERLHLLTVGDGELRGMLESRVATLGLQSRVHFLGARRDLGNILSAIDVFVMPSLWEGLPLSMVLAMGAGLPVVASAVAGIPELVRPGDTGWLATPGDADGLGAALADVLADPARAHAIGANARDYVRPRFGVDGYVNKMAALYDRLLAAKGRA